MLSIFKNKFKVSLLIVRLMSLTEQCNSFCSTPSIMAKAFDKNLIFKEWIEPISASF